MTEKLSRYELGEIQKLHDEAHYRCVSPEYLANQLKKIDLSVHCSRFEVAMRVQELERDIQARKLAERPRQNQ